MQKDHRVISIIKATGIGSTRKSAFDAALMKGCLHNLNLIALSSIIPPGVEIVRKKRLEGLYLPGSMQPVVLAQITSAEPDQRISAGIAWRLAREGGFFVEAARCKPERAVLEELNIGVREFTDHRDWDWLGDPHFESVETIVPTNRKYATALVCAVYEWVKVWGEISQ